MPSSCIATCSNLCLVPSETHASQSNEEPHCFQDERRAAPPSKPIVPETGYDGYELDISSAPREQFSDQQLLPMIVIGESDGAIELQDLSSHRSPSILFSKTNINLEDDKSETVLWGPRPAMWNPFWLRKSVLIAFGIVFAAMSAAVILLYHFSDANNGLANQEQSRHYAWTYGPTARKSAHSSSCKYALTIYHSSHHHYQSLATSRFLEQASYAVARIASRTHIG